MAYRTINAEDVSRIDTPGLKRRLFRVKTDGLGDDLLDADGRKQFVLAVTGQGEASSPFEVEIAGMTAHGFVVGDVIRWNGTTYVKAQANNLANSIAIGMVSNVPDADNFTYVTHGVVGGLSGLTAGAQYYLSAATAGAITTTPPAASGNAVRPVAIAMQATIAFFLNQGSIVNP